ncbi:MAG: RluA family pseudouridine synthase [Sandaracinus sp.]|nr:RluA family pseudouridine synthase [Myxococcales bacterium]MCB9601705.1 RluA family pseudouridine synthase [Sandaracinus sp.]MCB9631159.1 RluA family pseudouridine synthase [Sandaracinus sp.]
MAPSQPSQSVPPHLDGVRVDLVIAELFDLSRARAKALAEEGRVKLDGKRVRKGARVEAGQTIALDEPPPPRTFDALPDPSVELVIVHEDDACVIVDKPAGMPCHPLRPEELGTVANGLVARFPSMRGVGFAGREPGLVHRLDNDTSGLLLAAKHEAAFQTLVEALREGRVDKRYVALCAGTVETQTIPTPIVHHDARRMRVAEAGEKGAREARTEVLSSEAIASGSRVEVRARHARRHQVRVHLASIGHPLLGDTLYEGPTVEGLTRHALHASMLVFEGPAGPVDARSPLPEDLAALV